MDNNKFNVKGLTPLEVTQSRDRYGRNEIVLRAENGFIKAVKSIAKEPMVILLLVASTIYFLTGNIGDGFFLASAIIFIATISLYQDSRSRNALEKLKAYSEPKCKVIRNGIAEEIPSADIVLGDSLMVEEGTSITADGIIIQSNDFSVNESILTGESFSVEKNKESTDNLVFQGTSVTGGLAIISVTGIGNKTRLGGIGGSLNHIQYEKSPLELQINSFIKKMVAVGIFIFLVVWVVNYIKSFDILDSLLKSLTLAMSILPEEIPVAFSTFMALGAWRLMKLGIVVKQMKTVETLGSATVICTDKTGTITENKMTLTKIYLLSKSQISNALGDPDEEKVQLITTGMWASEPIPFDPMEVALHDAYLSIVSNDERPLYKMIHEYPLEGKPPMMTHLFENRQGLRIIAAKGAPEALLSVSGLDIEQKLMVQEAIDTLGRDGYRVLGVASANSIGTEFPEFQQEFKFNFLGLVAFYDPPKKNIPHILDQFYKAGIEVKIITGDNAATTIAIAKLIGLKDTDQSITGEELMKLNDKELNEKVLRISIFSRMFPEAKLKIINALKAGNQIVAMTGDGVNDGPALKAAHIGIAMGKKGTEIAKQAASLILVDDDLARMVDAIAMGRRIYSNLKKAIQYIISIHIPIILIVFLPLVLGWTYPNIFSPIHIIFLELVMGPTCSIIYENEPAEKNIMNQKPRISTSTFFSFRELTTSVLQGIVIAIGTLLTYQFSIQHGYSESLTRTIVFTTLIAANISLTLVNRSFVYSIVTTLKYKNNLVAIIISITMILVAAILFFDPITQFFNFQRISNLQLLLSIGVGVVSVIWYEIIKWIKRD
ncbi:MAG: cation-translocating P-type ATPase [Pedobacter sp.]|nr:cation-translocating P-type ATPase [Pedobacter sp.]